MGAEQSQPGIALPTRREPGVTREGDPILVFYYGDSDVLSFHAARAGVFGEVCAHHVDEEGRLHVMTDCPVPLRTQFPHDGEVFLEHCRCHHVYDGTLRLLAEAIGDFQELRKCMLVERAEREAEYEAERAARDLRSALALERVERRRGRV